MKKILYLLLALMILSCGRPVGDLMVKDNGNKGSVGSNVGKLDTLPQIHKVTISGADSLFNSQDVESICYSDGTDTLSGWKIHTYDVIDGYGFVIVDLDGDEVVGGSEVDSKYCDIGDPNCYESQNQYNFIDNSFTNASNENVIQITLTNGNVYQFTQPPFANIVGASKWVQQLEFWRDEIGKILDINCEGNYVGEVRWNPRPFNQTDFTGQVAPDGLNFPPSEIAGIIPSMQYRYLQFVLCSTCDAVDQAELIQVNGVVQDPPVQMTQGFEKGQLIMYTLCEECGEEGDLYYHNTTTLVAEADKPVCLFVCGTTPQTAKFESACDFDFEQDGCDDMGTPLDDTDDVEITRRYVNCDDEQPYTEYWIADQTDPTLLLSYTITGRFVDCETLEEILEPIVETPDIQSISEVEICFKNRTGIRKTTIDSEGTETLSFYYEGGDIGQLSSSDYTIGDCDCDIVEYYNTEILAANEGLIRTEYLTGNTAAGTGSWGDSDLAASIMDAFDPLSATPTTGPALINNGLLLNDSSNTAAPEQDIEYKEGYIIVSDPFKMYYNTNSEGAIRLEIGFCCGALVEQYTHAKGTGNVPTPIIEIPPGTHKIKLTNLDMGGSNSNWNAYVSFDNLSYTLDNTPNGVSFSSVKPNEECLKGYICNGVWYELDEETPIVFDELTTKCKIECTPSQSCKVNIVD